MSTDCENLLKRFLVLNPVKRSTLDQIMMDRWMNIGYEDDNMRPYSGQPPSAEPIDPVRVDIIASKLHLSNQEVERSIVERKFDESYAFYHILGRRTADVSTASSRCSFSHPRSILLQVSTR